MIITIELDDNDPNLKRILDAADDLGSSPAMYLLTFGLREAQRRDEARLEIELRQRPKQIGRELGSN